VEVYPRISQGNKTSKVLASIQLDLNTIIFSGMSVEANVIISERKNVLVIPREYLIEGNKVKKKGSKELTTIKKGASDLEFVEVLEGVDETNEIEIP
jgi:HlyD family secretion protein